MATKAKFKSVLPTHKAVLVDGRKIEYQGAHPTAWTFGGVDENGRPDGSPVETVPVLSILPGAVPDDEFVFDADPRDDVIATMQETIAMLKAKLGDKKDADIEELRNQVKELMGSKLKDAGIDPDEDEDEK